MKLKYYMRGLGIGIIITTLILMLSGSEEELSDKEIIKRAEALGMVMKEQTNKNLDELLEGIRPSVDPTGHPNDAPSIAPSEGPTMIPADGLEPTTEPTSAPTVEPTSGSELEPTQLPEPTITADSTQKPESSKAIEPTQIPESSLPVEPTKALEPTKIPDVTNQSPGQVTFTIERGMSSGQVAAGLEKLGLVKSADDFNQYIVNKGKASIIRVGTYTVPADASYGDLVSIITTAQ